MVCLQQAGNLIWWDFAKDCFIFHHAYNARSDKKIAYQCKWKRKARGGDCKHHRFQEFFTLRPSLQWLGLGVPGLLLLREPSWTGCQVGCSYSATCKHFWYIDDVCTHCMLNSKWTEQAWEPWSSSLSPVTSLSTLAGRRSSMSQGKPFQNHFHLDNLWKG